jgi:hypothetical protein
MLGKFDLNAQNVSVLQVLAAVTDLHTLASALYKT